MPIDWTINIGNVGLYLIGAGVAFWRLYAALDKRVSMFEMILKEHASTLSSHAMRMNKHEERIIDMLESVQRLIGRSGGDPH